jgi:uncharacterized protein
VALTDNTVDVGDGVKVRVLHMDGDRPGPRVALLGGVHGDELEGVLAVGAVLGHLDPAELMGSVVAVPVANAPAFAADERLSPLDGKNLARVFPGRKDGTITERIAEVLTRDVIAGSHLLIDLHSAGRNYEMPVFAGYVATGSPQSMRSAGAAAAFGAPLLWAHDRLNPGRSLTAAERLGVPSVYVEGGGGGAVRGVEFDRYVEGVLAAMTWLGMLSRPSSPVRTKAWLAGGDGDVDSSISAPQAGFCVTRVAVGMAIERGELIAEIIDGEGRLRAEIQSPRAGTVMMLRRTAPIEAGDPVAMLGPRNDGRS